MTTRLPTMTTMSTYQYGSPGPIDGGDDHGDPGADSEHGPEHEWVLRVAVQEAVLALGPRPAHLFLMLSVPGSRNAQVAPTVAITAAAREETTRPDLTWDRSGYILHQDRSGYTARGLHEGT